MNPPPSTPAAAPPQTDATLHVADDPLFDDHQSRGYHPERPERLAAARRAVARCADAGVRLLPVTARDATDDELARAHAPAYLDLLDRLRGHHAALDPDTYLSPASVPAARRAAGAAIALVEAILASPAPGVALLRPPGHHAARDRGMGFCLLNSISVAALAALDRGLSRVAIVDFDVHHGNGTQDILWRDPRALFISLHQWPFYPGTGAATDVGQGDGAGFTVNIPLSEGAPDPVYDAAFNEIVLPILDEHAPELILVSAGFDAHRRDPLASMQLTEPGYASMVSKLSAAAARTARGRLALILEGGYDLAALEASTTATLLAAAGVSQGPALDRGTDPPAISPRHRTDLDRARHVALRRWVTL